MGSRPPRGADQMPEDERTAVIVARGLTKRFGAKVAVDGIDFTVEPGRVTVKFGFSGRVLLGPRGKGGTVVLPVAIFATDAKREKIATDKATVDVAVSLDKPIGYFSTVKTITFPIPEGARPGEFEVFVGFDRNTPNAG